MVKAAEALLSLEVEVEWESKKNFHHNIYKDLHNIQHVLVLRSRFFSS